MAAAHGAFNVSPHLPSFAYTTGLQLSFLVMLSICTHQRVESDSTFTSFNTLKSCVPGGRVDNALQGAVPKLVRTISGWMWWPLPLCQLGYHEMYRCPPGCSTRAASDRYNCSELMHCLRLSRYTLQCGLPAQRRFNKHQLGVTVSLCCGMPDPVPVQRTQCHLTWRSCTCSRMFMLRTVSKVPSANGSRWCGEPNTKDVPLLLPLARNSFGEPTTLKPTENPRTYRRSCSI